MCACNPCEPKAPASDCFKCSVSDCYSVCHRGLLSIETPPTVPAVQCFSQSGLNRGGEEFVAKLPFGVRELKYDAGNEHNASI